MKIKYSLSRLDTIYGSIGYMAYNPSLRMAVKLVALTVGCFEVFKASQRFMEVRTTEVTNGFVIVAFMVFVPIAFTCIAVILFAAFTFLQQLLSSKKGIRGEHELEIDSEGLWERTAYNNTLHEWKSVCAVYENAYFYFIRVHIPAQAVCMIPKNECVVRDDLDTFIEKVRDGIRDSEHLRDKRGKPL